MTPSSPLHRARALAPLALGACGLVLIAWCGEQRASWFEPSSAATTIVDYDVFRLVGRLVLEGRATDAYTPAVLQSLEAQMSLDAVRSIPFAYPPPFALVMAALAPLPGWAGYAAFVVAGFALLAVALRRAAAPWFWPVMLAMTSAVFINVTVGQNGMLTAGLAGIAAGLALERSRGVAGILAGLLAALKPQSCVALPMLFVARRDWRSLILMAATAAALGAVSLALLGPAVVPAFLGAMAETSQALAQGRFQLHRMVSVYACLRSLGLSAGVSMALHVAAAVAVLAAVAWTARRLDDARAASGLTLLAACFVSPYLYDYDLPLAGLGLAMALPALDRAGPWWSTVAPLSALAAAESAGLVETWALPLRVSLGAPLLVGCLALVLFALTRRAPSRRVSPAHGEGQGSADAMSARIRSASELATGV